MTESPAELRERVAATWRLRFRIAAFAAGMLVFLKAALIGGVAPYLALAAIGLMGPMGFEVLALLITKTRAPDDE